MLRRKVGMLNCKLIVAFNGNSGQLEDFEASGKGGAETVVAAARVAVADDKDARGVARHGGGASYGAGEIRNPKEVRRPSEYLSNTYPTRGGCVRIMHT